MSQAVMKLALDALEWVVTDTDIANCSRVYAAIEALRKEIDAQPSQVRLSDDEIKAHGDKASGMMARDMTRFDAACEVMKYLRETSAPYYYSHRMLIVLHGNDEGTEASRAPDKPQPAQTGWRDIATAPKDGEFLIGRINAGRLAWAKAGHRGHGALSRLFYTVSGDSIIGPTHWDRLPPVPEVKP